MKKSIELLYLIAIVSSCSSKPDLKPISFWIFDQENLQLVNARSERLDFINPKLDNFICLDKEGQKTVLILSGARNVKRMDTESTTMADNK